MKIGSRNSLLFISALGVGACAPKDDPIHEATQPSSDSGSQSTTGISTTSVTTGIQPVDKGEYGEMEMCLIDMICEPFFHPLTAQGDPYHTDNSSGYLDVERCILTELRNGTVGRLIYGEHYDDGTFDDYIVHVHEGRVVTFSIHDLSDQIDEAGLHRVESYHTARTCSLKGPDYFDDCLLNHDDETHAYECMGEYWWQDCAPAGPRCE